MKLNKIEIRNFRSLGNVSIDLNDFRSGVCVIRGDNRDAGGSNGAGKSSLFDAIYWCLTNRFFIRAKQIQLKNVSSHLVKYGEENMSVAVEYSSPNGVHIARRSFPPAACWIDDIPVDNGTFVKSLPIHQANALGGFYVPYGYMSYLYRLHRGSGPMMENFIYSGGGLAYILFGKLIKDRVDKYKSDIKEYERQLKEANALSLSLQNSVDMAKEAVDATVRNIETLKSQSMTYQRQIERIEKSLSQIENPHKGPNYTRESEIDSLRKKLDAAESIVRDYNIAKEQLAKSISHFRESPQSCPVCNRPMMPDDYKKYILEKVAAVRRARRKLFESSYPKSLKKVSEFKDRLSELLIKSAVSDQYHDLMKEKGKLEDELARAFASKEDAERDLERLKRDYERMVNKIKEAEENEKVVSQKLEIAKRLDIRADFWYNWSKNRSYQSVSEFCMLLESLVNQALESLHSEITISMGVSEREVNSRAKKKMDKGPRPFTDLSAKKMFSKVYVDFRKGGKPVHPLSLSSGELQRCNIAASLALLDVIQCGFIMMDEPAVAFDESGNEDLYSLLNSYARSRDKQIFLIDHGSVGEYPYDKEIVVVKSVSTSEVYSN